MTNNNKNIKTELENTDVGSVNKKSPMKWVKIGIGIALFIGVCVFFAMNQEAPIDKTPDEIAVDIAVNSYDNLVDSGLLDADDFEDDCEIFGKDSAKPNGMETIVDNGVTPDATGLLKKTEAITTTLGDKYGVAVRISYYSNNDFAKKAFDGIVSSNRKNELTKKFMYTDKYNAENADVYIYVYDEYQSVGVNSFVGYIRHNSLIYQINGSTEESGIIKIQGLFDNLGIDYQFPVQELMTPDEDVRRPVYYAE